MLSVFSPATSTRLAITLRRSIVLEDPVSHVCLACALTLPRKRKEKGLSSWASLKLLPQDGQKPLHSSSSARYAQTAHRNPHSANPDNGNPIRGNSNHGNPNNGNPSIVEQLDQLQCKGMVDRLDPQTNAAAFASVLQICGDTKALAMGKRIHANILDSGRELTTELENLILQMYLKCGDLKEAHAVFTNMNDRHLSTCDSMLAAFAHHGQTKNALLVLHNMQQEGMAPNRFTLVRLLSACADDKDLAGGGRLAHSCIQCCGFESDIVVATAVVNLYGKCGSLKEAQLVFSKMPERNVISWTALITAYVHQEQGKEALQLFRRMELEGIIPNDFTVVSILSAFIGKDELSEGKRVHARIVGIGFQPDVVLGTSLLTMYGRCSSLEDGREVFNKMPERNLVTWTAMVTAYAEHGHGEKALYLYEEMQEEGIILNKVTFVSLLHTCTSLGALMEGKQIHADIVRSGFELDLVVGNAILDLHGKCGTLEDAQCMFDKMLLHDVVSWTSIISAFAMGGQSKEALQLFRQMETEGVLPNGITFISLLSACNSLTALDEGKQMHARIVGCGFDLDLVLGTALISMYGACGSPENAKKIFDEMPERDVVAWNTIIAECDSLEDAQEMFDNMPEHDEVSWNTIIAAFVCYGHYKSSLSLFQEMLLHGLVPTKYTLVSILEACGSRAALSEGKRMHVRIVSSGFEVDTIIGNALIHMYSRCGCLEDACLIFDKMQNWDVVSWTTMIAAYAQYGQGKEAIQLFQRMQVEGGVPNEVTLVSILCACSHAGLEIEGCMVFLSMSQTYAIPPTVDHYNCMVDLLGRLGRLKEGESLIHSMPCQPTATVWMTLLSTCRKHCDTECAQWMAEQIFELEPENTTVYIVLWNVYAAAGRCDDAEKLRKLVEDKGLKKQPGYSLSEVGGKVHEFCQYERCHRWKEEIDVELETLFKQMKVEEFMPQIKSILHDLEKNMKNYLLLSLHGETLGIDFGLIKSRTNTFCIA